MHDVTRVMVLEEIRTNGRVELVEAGGGGGVNGRIAVLCSFSRRMLEVAMEGKVTGRITVCNNHRIKQCQDKEPSSINKLEFKAVVPSNISRGTFMCIRGKEIRICNRVEAQGSIRGNHISLCIKINNSSISKCNINNRSNNVCM